MFMNVAETSRSLFNSLIVKIVLVVAVWLHVPTAGFSQEMKQSGNLAVAGFPGSIPVTQLNGRSYIDLESLARLTGGSIKFGADGAVLTLSRPPSNEETATSSKAESKDFSKDFLRTGIEQMTAVREWRIAIIHALQNSFPVEEAWVAAYRRIAESKLALVSAAVHTDSDRNALVLLTNEFGFMNQFTSKYVEFHKRALGTFPDDLANDTLDQQILSCARGLTSLVSSRQFEDVPACH